MYPYMKRTFDIVFSALALLLLLPLLAVAAICIKLDSRGPVLFHTLRIGREGKPFVMYKLRTMRHDAPSLRNEDGSCFVGRGDPRLTGLGRWLREFSVDELPQLWNVLIGDMSLIGPRPDEVSEAAAYDDLFRRKLLVRPGITNLPAVRGRNALTWRRRAELDSYYVDHLSFLLDLEILLKTPGVVLSRKGVYSPARESGELAQKGRS
ncbi:MAG: sugar transferase [Bryobacteraceae bacterium]